VTRFYPSNPAVVMCNSSVSSGNFSAFDAISSNVFEIADGNIVTTGNWESCPMATTPL